MAQLLEFPPTAQQGCIVADLRPAWGNNLREQFGLYARSVFSAKIQTGPVLQYQRAGRSRLYPRLYFDDLHVNDPAARRAD